MLWSQCKSVHEGIVKKLVSRTFHANVVVPWRDGSLVDNKSIYRINWSAITIFIITTSELFHHRMLCTSHGNISIMYTYNVQC